MGGSSVTVLLNQWRAGDDAALEQLMTEVYDDLRTIARRHLARERRSQVETSELVHMAYERLVAADVDYADRVHFFAVAARVMRRMLVDNARARTRKKRDGGGDVVTLSNIRDSSSALQVELLDLDEALNRLAERDARKAQVVECFYFGGLTQPEIAEALGISINTVSRDLRFARAWLLRALQGPRRSAS